MGILTVSSENPKKGYNLVAIEFMMVHVAKLLV